MPAAGLIKLLMYGEEEMKVLFQKFVENITVKMEDGRTVRHDAITNDDLLSQWDILKSHMVEMGWREGCTLSDEEVYNFFGSICVSVYAL